MSDVEATQYRSPLVIECPECYGTYTSVKWNDSDCVGGHVTCPYCGETSTIWCFSSETTRDLDLGGMKQEEAVDES
ncbi:hypothetical protein BPY_07000 [Bifidobacterium psychraerophilum]|uniref:hypothetical protein n=1 Tax=Bifidobacterium psychraerophilum TaxID=218140 RepID=UPI003115C224